MQWPHVTTYEYTQQSLFTYHSKTHGKTTDNFKNIFRCLYKCLRLSSLRFVSLLELQPIAMELDCKSLDLDMHWYRSKLQHWRQTFLNTAKQLQ